MKLRLPFFKKGKKVLPGVLVAVLALSPVLYFGAESLRSVSAGWHDEGNYRYYIGENGERVVGTQVIDGKTYYFDEDGYLCGDLVTDSAAENDLHAGTDKPAGYTETEADPFAEDLLSQYTVGAYTEKLWEGDRVYHENVAFIGQADGTVLSGSLLYTPDEIVTVRSYDLQTVYEEGRDFTVSGKKLVLTPNTRIPVCPPEVVAPYYPEGSLKDVFVTTFDEGRYISLDTSITVKYSVNVTYTHKDSWTGLTPKDQLAYLPKFSEKLKNGEDVNIVYFGDSITVGWEASGLDDYAIVVENCEEFHAVRNWAPYCSSWAKMVSEGMATRYGSKIHHINRAASGSTTDWGKKNAKMLVTPKDPDLVVLAFGMNQTGTSRTDMKRDLQVIMDEILAECPDTEFVLVSCMIPNPEANCFGGQILAEQDKAMYDIQAEKIYAVAVAPVYSMCMEMIGHGKTYHDITGNNFNHPNDFMHRIYAQTVLSVLGQ